SASLDLDFLVARPHPATAGGALGKRDLLVEEVAQCFHELDAGGFGARERAPVPARETQREPADEVRGGLEDAAFSRAGEAGDRTASLFRRGSRLLAQAWSEFIFEGGRGVCPRGRLAARTATGPRASAERGCDGARCRCARRGLPTPSRGRLRADRRTEGRA